MALRFLNPRNYGRINLRVFTFWKNQNILRNFRVNSVRLSSAQPKEEHAAQVTKPEKKTQKKTSVNDKKNREEEIYESKLSEEQRKGILQELNTRTLEQLTATKYVGKNKAEALVKHIQDCGPLTSLQELAGIKGFGKAFYGRLEQAGELPLATRKFSRQLEVMNTLLSNDLKQCISSIISIDIGLQNAAWVHMDRECQVLAWQQVHISRPKPYNPAVLMPQIQKFVDTLPTADAHVVEMQSHRVGKHAAALLPFVIHLRIVESMLHCLLPPPSIPFDPHYTSKHFGLPTGHAQKKKAAVSLVESLFLERKDKNVEDECESYLNEQLRLEGSKQLVRSLVGSSDDLNGEGEIVKDDPASSKSGLIIPSVECKLQISPELIEYFDSCKKKDDLSDSLLQALSFYHLMSESLK